MPPKADSKGTSDLPQKRRRVTRPRTASFAESESPDSQVSDAGKRPLSKRQKLRAGPLANEGAAQTPGTLTAIETICAEYPGLSPALVLSNPRVRAALQPFLDLPVIRPLAKNTRRRKPAALDLLSLGEADRTRAFTALCLQVTGVERDAPCERCSRGFGLWDRCVLSPPVISPDPLNGKCANNSIQSIGASAEEQPRRSERDQSTGPTKDSINVQVSSPSEGERPHTSQPILTNDLPLRVHSDLAPKPRSEPRAIDTAPLRRSHKEHTDTLATKNRNNLLKTAGFQSKRAEKGVDERARDSRIAELELERDEYRAGLRKEKIRSADLGQQILLLQSSRLTAHDDEVAAQVRDLQRQRHEAAASLRTVQDEKTTLVKKTEALEAEVTKLKCDLKSQRSQDESKMSIRNDAALEKQLRKEMETRLKMVEKMKPTSKVMDAPKRTIDEIEADINSKKTEGGDATRQIESVRSDAGQSEEKTLSLRSSKEKLNEQLEVTQEQLAKSRSAEGKALKEARVTKSENSELRARGDALSQSLTDIRKALKGVESEREALRDSIARLQRERDEQDRKMREKADDLQNFKAKSHDEMDKIELKLEKSREVEKTLAKKRDEQEKEKQDMAAKIMDLQASVRRTELALEEEGKEKSTLAKTIEGLQAYINRMELTLQEEEEEKKRLAKKSSEQKGKMRDMSATIEDLRACVDRLKLASREGEEENKRLAKEMKEVFSVWVTGRVASPS